MESFTTKSKHEKDLRGGKKKAHRICQIIDSDYLSCASYREALTLESS